VLSNTEIPAPTFQANSVVPRQVHPHVGKCLCRIVATESWSHAKVDGTSKQRDAAREGAIGVRNVRRNVSDYNRNSLQLPAKNQLFTPPSPAFPALLARPGPLCPGASGGGVSNNEAGIDAIFASRFGASAQNRMECLEGSLSQFPT
jgi:hypothetical protein